MDYKVFIDENGFEMVSLTDEQKDFLKGYTPKSRFCTSEEEMDRISEVFGLDGVVPSRAIRNSVVMFYDDYMDEVMGSTDRYMGAMRGMMSVTAVIDHYKYTF